MSAQVPEGPVRLLVGPELDEGVGVGELGPDAFMETVDAKRPGVAGGHKHSRGPAVLGAS